MQLTNCRATGKSSLRADISKLEHRMYSSPWAAVAYWATATFCECLQLSKGEISFTYAYFKSPQNSLFAKGMPRYSMKCSKQTPRTATCSKK